MTNQEIRNGFNQMITAAAAAGNHDAVAKFEVAREYFTNQAFKAYVQDTTWALSVSTSPVIFACPLGITASPRASPPVSPFVKTDPVQP